MYLYEDAVGAARIRRFRIQGRVDVVIDVGGVVQEVDLGGKRRERRER
jgi:hypothetical protein